ncbi:MAG: DUF1549 domain-containing protein [Myxococcales bacterium]|nr:DUF1549 domain-containing protein [Myxococcales bacterium]
MRLSDRRTLGVAQVASVAAIALAALAHESDAHAQRTVDEYRYFRALSIDLVGRIPTRAEIAAFEQPAFNVESWIDMQLATPEAAERVRRVYMDRLRLEVNTVVQLNPRGTMLRRIPVRRANGTTVWVYYRMGQRRANVDIDGTMCFTPQELGVQYPSNGEPRTDTCNTPRVVSDAVFNARTTPVKPWWLYRDYRAANPTQRYNPTTWAAMAPGYEPVEGMLEDAAGNPVNEVYVCNEEAQTAPTGRTFIAGTRTPTPATGCNARILGTPNTDSIAMPLMGRMLSCETQTGFNLSTECGCGPGLERCLPGVLVNNQNAGALVNGALRAPIGNENALENRGLSPGDWMRLWLSQEAAYFMDAIFQADRDVRDIVRARDTYVNGPLAVFYRSQQQQSCCNTNHLRFDYSTPTHLFVPSNVPTAVLPHDVDRWARVPDRGPLASGILTMPIFLTKYGTRRARAHVLYQAFMCQEFVAGNGALTPSDQPDLTLRPGCRDCHRTLEPMSAFFTRVTESDWTYLPAAQFPLDAARCRLAAAGGAMPAGCNAFYDPSFTNTTQSWMRGIYNLTAARANADAGPRGMGDYLAAQPQFGPCFVETVAESFLGRDLNVEDATLRTQLQTTLTGSAFRARAMIKQLLLSDAYRRANNLSSTAWREGATR